jgi:hypothetical protein
MEPTPGLPAPYDPAQGLRALEWRPRIDSYVIVTPELRVAASDDLAALKVLRQELDEARLNIVRHHREQAQLDTVAFAEPIMACDYAVDRLSRLCLGWDDHVERERRAEEARVRALALAEERRKAEEARVAKEAAREAREEAAAAAQRAQEATAKVDSAIDAGDTANVVKAAETAQHAQQEAVQQDAAATALTVAAEQAGAAVYELAAPIITPAPVKIAGESKRDNWTAEVVNLLELVQAIARGEQSIALVEVNQAALNGLARSLKKEFRVPGCQAVNKPGLSTRRRA